MEGGVQFRYAAWHVEAHVYVGRYLAARTRRGQGADAKDDTDGRAGRESGGRHRGARNRDMTGDHINPTRAWSRNTIHPLFPYDSLGAGVIIGAGLGGRSMLPKGAAQRRRQCKRGVRREAQVDRYLGPEPPPRGRWRGSVGTGALYLTKPNQKKCDTSLSSEFSVLPSARGCLGQGGVSEGIGPCAPTR